MYTIILIIIIYFLAKTIFRGLFDRVWREKIQDIIWSIENEKKFWHLMDKKINAQKVFFTYLRTRNQKDYIRVGDSFMDIYTPEQELDKNDLDIKTIKEDIKETDGIKLIAGLNQKIDEKEEIITNFFKDNKNTFTEEEIINGFKELEKNSLVISDVTKNYSSFTKRHLDFLLEHRKSSLDIWNVLKRLESADQNDLEYDLSGNKEVDFLISLKTLQNDIDNFIIDLLCKKNKNNNELRKELKTWQHLHMLRWCIADYSVMRNLSIINEKLWRFVILIFM